MRPKGDHITSSNHEVKKAWTFDARSMVQSYADLLGFTEDDYIPNGFPVSVWDTDRDKIGVYVCTDNTKLNLPGSWLKTAGGSIAVMRFEPWVPGRWDVGQYAINGNLIATPKVPIADSQTAPTGNSAFWRIVYNPTFEGSGNAGSIGEKLDGTELFTSADLRASPENNGEFLYTLSEIPAGHRYVLVIEGNPQHPDDFTVDYPLVTFHDSVGEDQRMWVEVWKLLSEGTTTPPPTDSKVFTPAALFTPENLFPVD